MSLYGMNPDNVPTLTRTPDLLTEVIEVVMEEPDWSSSIACVHKPESSDEDDDDDIGGLDLFPTMFPLSRPAKATSERVDDDDDDDDDVDDEDAEDHVDDAHVVVDHGVVVVTKQRRDPPPTEFRLLE